MITDAITSDDRFALERARAGQHLVEDDAERPDVGALVDGFALACSGRHVRGGAEIMPMPVIGGLA